MLGESNLLARAAAQRGISFGPMVYELATTLGYKGSNGNGNGRVTTPEVSQAARILQQAAKGQAVQGLSRAQSTGGEGVSRYATMTAAEIAQIPDNVWQRDWANPRLRNEMQAAMRRIEGLDNDDEYFSARYR